MQINQDLMNQINQLPSLEKLHLAEILLADLDVPNPEIDAVWGTEAQERWQAYKNGGQETVNYEAVMQKYK